MNINTIGELRGKRCEVLGIGISNLPLIRELIKAGAVVCARDKKERVALGETADELEALGAKLILGEDYLAGIDGDYIFRSPGIRPDIPEIAEAVSRGAVLTSEMKLFCALTKAKLICVTGSDGKTTTTTLTHLFLDSELGKTGNARAYVGGNIGRPLLPICDVMAEDDFAVLELSSFQLMDMDAVPMRAAITNVTPNHLNWHTDMEEYTRAKCNIFGKETELVLNADNPISAEIASRTENKKVLFSSSRTGYDVVSKGARNCAAVFFERDGYIVRADSEGEEKILAVGDILLPGRHNVENYMTAIALTYGLVSLEVYRETAKSFGGVEHRLELVRELNGVKYYNSSIDSTPTRTAAALGAVDGSKIVICGGRDKGVSFEPLAKVLCERARCVILTGEAAEKIKKAIEDFKGYKDSGLEVCFEPSFEGAVALSSVKARSGELVILSPACTSFDIFNNFEERGRYFKKLVSEL